MEELREITASALKLLIEMDALSCFYTGGLVTDVGTMLPLEEGRIAEMFAVAPQTPRIVLSTAAGNRISVPSVGPPIAAPA